MVELGDQQILLILGFAPIGDINKDASHALDATGVDHRQ